MYISHILFPVKVLGPGNRIGIWMAGCIHSCPGCSNPELWVQDEKHKTNLDSVMELISLVASQNTVDGFTITGGDPFYQPEALRTLIQAIRPISPDILVYTGYQYEDLPQDIIDQVAVIIDGKYEAEKNTGEILRGSNNQRIFVKPEFQKLYNDYIKNRKSEIQNFSTKDGIISVGIHLPGYEMELKKAALEKGLEETKNV